MNDFDVKNYPKDFILEKSYKFKIDFLLTGSFRKAKKISWHKRPFLVTSTGVNYQLFKLIIQR